MISPDVVSRAAVAPKIGHGLGSTMWYECAWWAIRCFLVGRGLIGERRRRLELWRLLLLGLLVGEGWWL